MIKKGKRYRNKKYLDWIRSDENVCQMCGQEGYESNQLVAHHAISIPGLRLGGTGTKASDTLAIPLHAICHADFHQHFYNYKEDQPIWLMRQLEKSLQYALKER